MEEIPSLKALVERQKDRPFALLGVNTDEIEPAALAKKMAAKGVTWRQAVQGSTDGPLPTLWNVHGYPTIFVLDEEGVIRHTDARGVELDDAVARLLDALAKKKDAKPAEAPQGK